MDTEKDEKDNGGQTGYESASISVPSFTKWSVSQIYDYNESIVDYNTLDELDTAMKRARTAIFLITDKINEYERKERGAKMLYDRSYRRAYLLSTEKTEAAKRARSELKCENLENEWVTFEQLKLELNRTAYAMRKVGS